MEIAPLYSSFMASVFHLVKLNICPSYLIQTSISVECLQLSEIVVNLVDFSMSQWRSLHARVIVNVDSNYMRLETKSRRILPLT